MDELGASGNRHGRTSPGPKPLGTGPDILAPPTEWPESPVLILGPSGSGRRTWANWLAAAHGARMGTTIRSEDRAPASGRERATLTAALAREVAARSAIRTRSTMWTSLELDGASRQAQNALLKTLEEPSPNSRTILRATSQAVLPTIASRCTIVHLRPATPQAERDLLESLGLDETDAESAQAARPGRPGAALAMAAILPARDRAEDLLSAAEACDRQAVAANLNAHEPGTLAWTEEWAREAMAGRPEHHGALARRAGRTTLSRIETVLRETGGERLALRAAMTILIRHLEANR